MNVILMLLKSPIVVGITVLILVGGIQQYRLEQARGNTSKCELRSAQLRAHWETARADAALDALRQTAEAERLREQLVLERRVREQEARERQEELDDAREAARKAFEGRLRDSSPSCQAWLKEVIPCPVG